MKRKLDIRSWLKVDLSHFLTILSLENTLSQVTCVQGMVITNSYATYRLVNIPDCECSKTTEKAHDKHQKHCFLSYQQP